MRRILYVVRARRASDPARRCAARAAPLDHAHAKRRARASCATAPSSRRSDAIMTQGTDAEPGVGDVPMMVGRALRRHVGLENYEREDAFEPRPRCGCWNGRLEHGRGARERAAVRREPAPRARVVGAHRGRPRPVVVARPGDGDGPDRAPREGAAAGEQQRHLPARSPMRKAYRALVAFGDTAEAIRATTVEAGVGIIGSLIAERPARAHQRHRRRPARRADSRHRQRAATSA